MRGRETTTVRNRVEYRMRREDFAAGNKGGGGYSWWSKETTRGELSQL